jgi:methanogenic corrinoid protein MtbC1
LVVSPALARIGDAWAAGTMSVAHEHLATAVIRERLLERLRETTPEAARETAVLACADEEQHDLGVIAFALHAAAWGIRPIVLGAQVPPVALGAAVAQLRPSFVGISVVMPIPPARARTMLAAYAKQLAETRWIVGGPGASSIGEVARTSHATVVTTLDDARRAIFGR